MRIEDFTFEQKPTCDLPRDDVTQWLADFGGDDQWVDSDGRAAVVLGNHIIIWQDEPLTDEDRRIAVTDYERTMTKIAAEEVFGDFLEEYDWDFESMIAPLLRFILETGLRDDFERHLAEELGNTASGGGNDEEPARDF